jgi:hypothetical protein
MIALALMGLPATPPAFMAIISNTGSTMGVASFQLANPTSPGYVSRWGTVSTTGLTGITGTAYGVFYVVNAQATVAGTIATIAIYNPFSLMFIGALASPIPVVANQFVQVSVAVFTGFSSWFGSISAVGVSVTTVSVNVGFLQSIPFIFLPSTILSLTTLSYAFFINSIVVGTGQYLVSLPPQGSYGSSLALLTWASSITPATDLSASIISWIGVASPAVRWGGVTTIYTFYVTVQAVLSTSVIFPGGITHFFTLSAYWIPP